MRIGSVWRNRYTIAIFVLMSVVVAMWETLVALRRAVNDSGRSSGRVWDPGLAGILFPPAYAACVVL
jgi:hypothetical protein